MKPQRQLSSSLKDFNFSMICMHQEAMTTDKKPVLDVGKHFLKGARK